MGRWFNAAATMMLAGQAEAACLDVSKPENPVALDGTLLLVTVPGPPGYEDVAKGDTPEEIEILQLARFLATWNHVADKEARQFNTLEHVLIAKPSAAKLALTAQACQLSLWRDML